MRSRPSHTPDQAMAVCWASALLLVTLGQVVAGAQSPAGPEVTRLPAAQQELPSAGAGLTPELPVPPPIPAGDRAAGTHAAPPMPIPPRFHVPMATGASEQRVQLSVQGGRVSLAVRDVQMQDVLAALAEAQHVNIVCATNANSPLTITLREVPLDEALTAIVSSCGCTWTVRGTIIHVTDLATKAALAPDLLGKYVQVFPLSFCAGDDLLQAIKTMLSPAGNAYVAAVADDNNRRTQESLVVEDVPQYLGRIGELIHQMDQPPKQVVIDVHVLQVNLEAGCRHGVDWTHMMNFANHTMGLTVTGLANDKASPAFLAELSAGNLVGLIEAVKDTKDSKTLASPRILALNGQTSRIQIGEKLGYRVLSNTQTATLESVEFLDVGVVLSVTPTISDDGRVLLKVNPKVSSGEIVEDTGLPNEKTSEVETNVLLNDGQGIVIGGLIQEEDIKSRSKLMFLGDIYLIGTIFQRRVETKTRKEIIFFILPRIVNNCTVCSERETIDHQRVETELFHGPLHPNCRPYDVRFPSCLDRPCQPWLQPLHDRIFGADEGCGCLVPGPAWPGEPAEQVLPAGALPPGGRQILTVPADEKVPLPTPGDLDLGLHPAPRTAPVIARRPELIRLPSVDTLQLR